MRKSTAKPPVLLAEWLAERGLDESNFDVLAHSQTWNRAVAEASLYLRRRYPLLTAFSGDMLIDLLVDESGKS